MKIFISWSGERSRSLAALLWEWIPTVLQSARPWMSDADVQAGDRWAVQVGGELQAADFGILCLASDNLFSPWLLFEAGALSKSLSESAVCPVLLDVQFAELTGPLAQFQAKKIDSQGMRDLIISLNSRSSEPVAESRLHTLFNALWPDFQARIDQILAQQPAAVSLPALRTTPDVLEDVLASIRAFEGRLLSFERRIGRQLGFDRDEPTDNEFVETNSSHAEFIREELRRALKAKSAEEVASELGISLISIRSVLNKAPIQEREWARVAGWFLKQVTRRD